MFKKLLNKKDVRNTMLSEIRLYDPEIVRFLDANKIKDYKISVRGIVDVDGDVDLREKNLTKIPISVKFGKVAGDFDCSHNKLTSLKGSPKYVGESFRCSHNRLISLEGAPKHVDYHFICSHNKLASLEGSPDYVGEHFNCDNNKLVTLKGAPKHVGGDFSCIDNNLSKEEIDKFLDKIRSREIYVKGNLNGLSTWWTGALLYKSNEETDVIKQLLDSGNIRETLLLNGNTKVFTEASIPDLSVKKVIGEEAIEVQKASLIAGLKAFGNSSNKEITKFARKHGIDLDKFRRGDLVWMPFPVIKVAVSKIIYEMAEDIDFLNVDKDTDDKEKLDEFNENFELITSFGEWDYAFDIKGNYLGDQGDLNFLEKSGYINGVMLLYSGDMSAISIISPDIKDRQAVIDMIKK